MSSLIFPYRTLHEDLAVVVDGDVKVGNEDGQEQLLDSEMIDAEARSIDVTDSMSKGAEYLTVPLKVMGSERAISLMAGDLSLVVSAECSITRTRQATRFSTSSLDSAIWKGNLRLDLINFREVISVRAVLTGPRLGLENRYLGESAEWNIYLAEQKLPDVRGALPVKWTDFATDEERRYLHPYSSEPYYADLAEDPPLVILNSGFEGLPELFPEQGAPPSNLRALHETTRISIARSVWLGLFQTAVAGIIMDTPEEQPRWPERTWQQDVLKQILPRIYEETDIDEALRMAAEDRNVAEKAAWLESRAVAVIGKDILNEGKYWRTAIKAVGAS